MSTLFDLLLLLVIGKEALQFGTDLPPMLWMTFVIGLPFMLGMANSMRENRSSIVREPIRAFIGEGLTLATVILFVVFVTYQGLAAVFWTLFGVMLVPYGMGRVLGMTAKGLLLISSIIFGIFIFRGFFGVTA